jgi:exodeoxyribonuclease III
MHQLKTSCFKTKPNHQRTRTYKTTPETTTKAPKTSTHRWVYGLGRTSQEFRIATWNVNGIRAIKNNLENYLAGSKIDIICVNETKINEEAYDQKPIELNGYHSYWNFCKCSAGYSGVAVFSKFLPISMKEDLPQLKHQHEGRLMTLEFELFYLVTVYVVNSGSNGERLAYRTKEWDVDFRNYCQMLRMQKNVIVAGDLNVVRSERDIYMATGGDLNKRLMPGCTLAERNNIETMLKLGWVDTFREMHPEKVQYTWWNVRIKVAAFSKFLPKIEGNELLLSMDYYISTYNE